MGRSADAEPEAKADADPYLLYGGYYGKRSADADPAVVAPVVGYPYALPYAAPAVVPATQSITSPVVTHTLGEPIVNEHPAVVPTLAYYGKRSADAEAEA